VHPVADQTYTMSQTGILKWRESALYLSKPRIYLNWQLSGIGEDMLVRKRNAQRAGINHHSTEPPGAQG